MKKIIGAFLIAGIGGFTALGIDHLLEPKVQTSSQINYQQLPT